jgi:hypothetical protein
MSKSSRPKSKPKSSSKPGKQESKSNQKEKDKQEKEPSLQEKVAQDQADLAKWTSIAALPGLSPQAADVARNAARSSQAAVTLGQKALLYQEPENAQTSEGTPSPQATPTIVSPEGNPTS